MTNKQIIETIKGGHNMKSINEITKSGDYYAIGDNGKKYNASYDADLGCMFFAIPASVQIVGYIER